MGSLGMVRSGRATASFAFGARNATASLRSVGDQSALLVSSQDRSVNASQESFESTFARRAKPSSLRAPTRLRLTLASLVAVLLGLLAALLFGHVGARQARLLLAARHDLLDLAGLADVPGHGPAVLAVAVPLGLLVPRAPLQLAHLLGLEVAVLPLLGLGVLVGHLLAE